MIAQLSTLLPLAALAAWAILATVVVTAQDGYRRIPTGEPHPFFAARGF